MHCMLTDICADWQRWALTADKSENGWESDFPRWQELIRCAKESMVDYCRAGPLLCLPEIELCWAISEEEEELSDFAQSNLDQCWNVVCDLASSERSEVRWQVYKVLGAAGVRGEALLRRGLEDPDAYSRRRALLSLAALRPGDADKLAEKYAKDSDRYMRLAAVDLAGVAPSSDARQRAVQFLLSDADDHVRAHARRRLQPEI